MLALRFVFVSSLHPLPGYLWVTLASEAAFLWTTKVVLWFWICPPDLLDLLIKCVAPSSRGKSPNAAKRISLPKFSKPLCSWFGLTEAIGLETVTVPDNFSLK